MIILDFDSHLYIEDTPLECLPYVIQGCHMFAKFYAHAYVKNGEYLLRITLTTFTRFVQNSTVWCMLALYGPTMHVATLKSYFQAR